MENPSMKKPNDHAEPTKFERQKINFKNSIHFSKIKRTIHYVLSSICIGVHTFWKSKNVLVWYVLIFMSRLCTHCVDAFSLQTCVWVDYSYKTYVEWAMCNPAAFCLIEIGYLNNFSSLLLGSPHI